MDCKHDAVAWDLGTCPICQQPIKIGKCLSCGDGQANHQGIPCVQQWPTSREQDAELLAWIERDPAPAPAPAPALVSPLRNPLEPIMQISLPSIPAGNIIEQKKKRQAKLKKTTFWYAAGGGMDRIGPCTSFPELMSIAGASVAVNRMLSLGQFEKEQLHLNTILYFVSGIWWRRLDKWYVPADLFVWFEEVTH